MIVPEDVPAGSQGSDHPGVDFLHPGDQEAASIISDIWSQVVQAVLSDIPRGVDFDIFIGNFAQGLQAMPGNLGELARAKFIPSHAPFTERMAE